MYLSFLGNGAAFNYESCNTSAYFIYERGLYLIDCGEKICDKILSINLLEKIDVVNVFITHLHSDHIGSLEPLVYYLHFFTDKKYNIFYPKRGRLKKLLQLTGLSFDFKIRNDFDKFNSPFRVVPVEQKHIYGSYGYFFYGPFNFFYSGDTSVVNKEAVRQLNEGKIDCIYHEVTTSTNAMIHTTLETLSDIFDAPSRNKVYLMHFSDKQTIAKCAERGFAVTEEVTADE